MPYGTVNADKITTSDGVSSAGLYGFKNRLINSDMRIDQRNAGASGTGVSTSANTVDRWGYYANQASKGTWQQNAGSVTPPAGFTNYLGFTSSSAYSVLTGDIFEFFQRIEGLNMADFAWGTASAATITLSFWVRSSLTGSFGGSLSNSALNRSYPFSYTISSANTWEQKSVTIVGDTTGTWLTTNGIGATLVFSLGCGATYSGTAGAWAAGTYVQPTGSTSVVGTNGATFYITGVQLEKGSTATSFDYRPYGTELQLCQRYLPIFNASGTSTTITTGYSESTTATRTLYEFIVTPRVPPTGITISAAGDFTVSIAGGSAVCTSLTFNSANSQSALLIAGTASGLTAGQPNILRQTSTAGQIQFTGCEL